MAGYLDVVLDVVVLAVVMACIKVMALAVRQIGENNLKQAREKMVRT